ncbi:Mitochondrial inner membrane protease atp23, partial [Spiromyces aspiralis]
MSESSPSSTTTIAVPAAFAALSVDEKQAVNTWSRYFKQLTGIGLSKEELGNREARKQREAEEIACDRCERWRDELLKSSPIVKFMSDHLRRSGFVADGSTMPCVKCEELRSGGFSPEEGIQLCWNRFF